MFLILILVHEELSGVLLHNFLPVLLITLNWLKTSEFANYRKIISFKMTKKKKIIIIKLLLLLYKKEKRNRYFELSYRYIFAHIFF